MFWTAIKAQDDRAPESDFWYQGLPMSGNYGHSMGTDVALSLPAVYAAARVITEAVMQIPLLLYRRLEDGGKERATNHPLYGLLHREPNEYQTAAEWREVMQHHLLMRGNAYSQIFVGGNGAVAELGMPIHPDLVTPEWRVQAGRRQVVYKVRQGGNEEAYQADKILHLRALGVNQDGITGLNPIQCERRAIGVGLQSQDFMDRFLANDATPGGWIEHPGNFKSDEQRDGFRKSWQDSQTGANWRKIAVLEYGLKYHPVDLKLADAQFLEARKYTNMDVARIFRVPPHLIMELDRATFSNITQQDIEFVKFTMLPWLVRWEQRLSKQLLMDDEVDEYFAEFLVDGLERGDGEARSSYYKAGIQDGWLTRNEVRRRENLNPIDGLDEPLEPLNMRNPGGANDERLNALKLNAAKVCAKKQRHAIESMTQENAEAYLRSDVRQVRRFMECSTGKAQQACDYSANQLADHIDASMPFDAWELRQVQILVEMT